MAVYVTSDFHGFYSIYEKINNFLKEDDTVIFLGDASDRGPYGWKTIKAILDNPKWTYLMGNHEEMVMEYINKGYSALHDYNGGKPTQLEIDADDKATIKNYYAQLRLLPYSMTIINENGKMIWLSHSGNITTNKDDLVWSRNHWFQSIKNTGYDYVIHGHTPIPYMIENINEILECCGEAILPNNWQEGTPYTYFEHNINLDNLTIVTHKATLLNIDTFESYCFEADESLDYSK